MRLASALAVLFASAALAADPVSGVSEEKRKEIVALVRERVSKAYPERHKKITADIDREKALLETAKRGVIDPKAKPQPFLPSKTPYRFVSKDAKEKSIKLHEDALAIYAKQLAELEANPLRTVGILTQENYKVGQTRSIGYDQSKVDRVLSKTEIIATVQQTAVPPGTPPLDIYLSGLDTTGLFDGQMEVPLGIYHSIGTKSVGGSTMLHYVHIPIKRDELGIDK